MTMMLVRLAWLRSGNSNIPAAGMMQMTASRITMFYDDDDEEEYDDDDDDDDDD